MTTLEDWLAQATRGLSVESTARVRQEIEAHYRSALQEPGADEQSALRSLGDPKAANCQYRKVLLTASEARTLRSVRGEAAWMCSRRWVMAIPFVLCIGISVWGFAGGASARITLAPLFAAVGVGFLAIAGKLPIYTVQRGRVARALRWVWLIGLMWLGFGSGPLFWSLMPALLWTPLYVDWNMASLRRKLPVEQWPKSLYL